MTKFSRTLLIFILLSSTILSLGLAGCSANPEEHALAMASMDHMPDSVKAAPVVVREAYQFAAANPEVTKELPCYCGCGSIGHTSNYDCYIAEVAADGSVTKYDEHALGCSICVDISQDAMRMLKDGKSVTEIRTFVDATYSKYGPSNIPD